jgi:hypothetical protein
MKASEMNKEAMMEKFGLQKRVSQLDEQGYFVGPVMADLSPLDKPGHYLIPGGAIDCAPPDSMERGRLYRPAEGGGWTSVEDLRQRTLYSVTDGQPYHLGAEINGQRYEGIGPFPEWLTLQARPNEWNVWSGSAWIADESLLAADMTRQRVDERAGKLAYASQQILLLQDAHSLNIATPEELDLLQRWRRYRVELSRIDPADPTAGWPVQPG